MKHSPPSRRRRAFTLEQLLVLLALLPFFFGFMTVGVARVRQAANRAMSQNNLRQLALATIDTADMFEGKMPPGLENWYPNHQPSPGNGYGSCLFHILPTMDQKSLYDSSSTRVGVMHVYAAWTLAGSPVKTFFGQDDPTADPTSDRTSYLANGLAIPLQGARFPGFYQDGVSNTIFF